MGILAFQYNALYNTGTTSGVYTAQTPTFTFQFTIGAGGGSDATVPANGSSLTLYINPGGVKMEIKISFAASGTSNTTFQVDGAEHTRLFRIYTRTTATQMIATRSQRIFVTRLTPWFLPQ